MASVVLVVKNYSMKELLMPRYCLKIQNEEFTIFSPDTLSGNDGKFRLCAGDIGQVIGAYPELSEAVRAFAEGDTENMQWNETIQLLTDRPQDISGWEKEE